MTFTVPGQLKVWKSPIPILKKQDTIQELRKFETELRRREVHNMQIFEREKTYFRMFLNIKKRFQHNPQKFIKLFKLYLNQVPSFQKRWTDQAQRLRLEEVPVHLRGVQDAFPGADQGALDLRGRLPAPQAVLPENR